MTMKSLNLAELCCHDFGDVFYMQVDMVCGLAVQWCVHECLLIKVTITCIHVTIAICQVSCVIVHFT